MKPLLIILMLFCSLLLFAPGVNSILIVRIEPIEPFKTICKAVVEVESHGDMFAYNPKECAVGCLQIRPIRIKDYNSRTGSHYKLEDCYDYEVSKRIFMFYANKFGPYETDKMIMALNGKGVKAREYLKKVKLILNN